MEIYRKIVEIKKENEKKAKMRDQISAHYEINQQSIIEEDIKEKRLVAEEKESIVKDDINNENEYKKDQKIDNNRENVNNYESKADGNFEERLDALEDDNRYSFVWVIVIALVTWMVVRLWYDALQIFLYSTMKLNKDSLTVTLGVAFFVTFVFVGIILLFDLSDFVK